MKFGFKKAERLKSKKAFKKLFAAGKRFVCDGLTIIYLPAAEQKAGFITSRKIGGAAKRNRVKRTLREAYRMNKELFKGLETIFYADAAMDANGVQLAFGRFKERRCRI